MSNGRGMPGEHTFHSHGSDVLDDGLRFFGGWIVAVAHHLSDQLADHTVGRFMTSLNGTRAR